MWMVVRVCNKTSKNIYVASCVKDGGIYHYKMKDGILQLQDVTKMDRPMYMVVENQKMYIVLRAPFHNNESGVIVYDIGEDGRLENPSELISTKGEVACYIAVHKNQIYCANYISGSVVKLPNKVAQHRGQGICPNRQEAPHVHYVGVTPDSKYVCATDLGLDTIFLYHLDLKLHKQVKVPEGHGVRHLVFSSDGKYLFAVNELMSTVVVFSYDNGQLELIDCCEALPRGFKGESTAAAIRVRNGLIYVSNRGHDSIAVLQFCNDKLEIIDYIDCEGKTPRDFYFVDDYLLVANQDSDEVCSFDIQNDFRLSHKVEVEMPVCVCEGFVDLEINKNDERK